MVILPKVQRDPLINPISIDEQSPQTGIADDETGLKQLEQPLADNSPLQTEVVHMENITEAGLKLSPRAKKWVYWISLSVICFGLFGIIWSRVYLGAHSITQVLLGSVLGFIYAEFYFCSSYKSQMKEFAKLFFLNFSNEYERKYMTITTLLYIPIFNILMGLLYLIRLREQPQDRNIYEANMLASMCGDYCGSTDNFEWREYTSALYVNGYFGFSLAMLIFNKDGYKYDPEHYRLQRWKHIILRNSLVIICALISGLPQMMLKPLSLRNDLFVVVAKLMTSFILCGLMVYVVPSIYQKCKIEARGGFI